MLSRSLSQYSHQSFYVSCWVLRLVAPMQCSLTEETTTIGLLTYLSSCFTEHGFCPMAVHFQFCCKFVDVCISRLTTLAATLEKTALFLIHIFDTQSICVFTCVIAFVLYHVHDPGALITSVCLFLSTSYKCMSGEVRPFLFSTSITIKVSIYRGVCSRSQLLPWTSFHDSRSVSLCVCLFIYVYFQNVVCVFNKWASALAPFHSNWFINDCACLSLRCSSSHRRDDWSMFWISHVECRSVHVSRCNKSCFV